VVDAFMIHGSNAELDAHDGTPVMRLMAEGDVRAQSESAEADGEYFRRWEVAGTSHVGYTEYLTFAPLIARDVPGTEPQECDRPSLSRIPFQYPLNAAYQHMVDWISEGTAPPEAPRLEWDDALEPSTDSHGNRLGGIRLAEHEVATALNHGVNSGDPFCFLQGTHIPFAEDTLQELYPARGHHLGPVNRTVNQAQREGYLLQEDAQASRHTAKELDYAWW
jgi:hypothetical protein